MHFKQVDFRINIGCEDVLMHGRCRYIELLQNTVHQAVTNEIMTNCQNSKIGKSEFT